MKSLRNLFGIALISSISLNVSAQYSSVTQQRFAIDNALSTIEDYAAYVTISDEDIHYSFLNLFTSPEAPVYNDLLGVATSRNLTAKEYGRLLSKGLKNKIATIKNVTKDDVSKDGDVWKIRMSFDKSISYVNDCGTYFSSDDFYGKDYRLSAVLVYDETDGSCKIESISGKIDSDKKLDKEYFVFINKDKRDLDLTVRNQKLSFNRYHQAFVPGSKESLTDKDFSYPDASIVLKPQVDQCGVSMKYIIRRLRLRPYYEFGLGNAFSINSTSSLSKTESSASSFGVDFGYVFFSKKVISLGAFLGVGLTQSKIELAFNRADYFFRTDVDIDGESYIRHYENLNLEQKYKFSDFIIPVYLEMDIQANKILAFYVDLGVKMHFNLKHDVDHTQGAADIYGIYPQYDNLRLDGQWGSNGFGSKNLTASNLVNSELLDVSGFTASLMGGLGVRINIPRTIFAIDAGVNYVLGLNDFIATSSPAQLGNDITRPIVYPTLTNSTCTEHVRNLSEALTNAKRQSLKLHVGLTLKF